MPRKRPTTEAEWEQKRAEDRARYHANPAKFYVASRKWAQANRDRVNERRRQWRAANPRPKKEKVARTAMTDEQKRAVRHAYYLAHKEEIRAKQSTREHRDYINKQRKERRKNDPVWASQQAEKRRAKRGYPGPKRIPIKKDKKPFKANKPKLTPEEYKAYLKSYRRAYYLRNREVLCSNAGAWKRANREKVRASNSARDARKKELIHPESDKDKIDAIYKETARMTAVTGIEHETDHVIPTKKKGYHHQDNLSPLPASINSSKQDDPFWLASSMEYKDWRDVPRHLWPEKLAPKYLELIEANRGKSIRWDTAA